MSLVTDVRQAAADRLWQAAQWRTPCPPIRDLVAADDVESAYAISSINVARRLEKGALRVGRKIGLTSEAVQRQLGVGTPDFGALLDDMVVAPGGVVPTGVLLQPKVEAEVAFVLTGDLDGALESTDEVRAAIGGAMAAIEIVDSRIADWDIKYADTVADNASCGLYVVSDTVVPLADVEPVEVSMTMSINGEEVSTGSGAACLGDPLNAVLWLARTLRDVGDPLRAGEVVLSGALGPMAVVRPGDSVETTITGLGTVSVRFAEESA
ncbi:MAG: fumarylacetoacetate hydrolase family protein [Actinobacteria bacterium]|nr:fumarylacetoacetate hydrolase family protein [Actinomycetota bacterium]